MGGYKTHGPMLYLVRWPDGVTKLGFTTKQRWRHFVINGASVLALYEFETSGGAFAAESAGQTWMAERFPYSFDSIEVSFNQMGPDGGGYAECFTIPAEMMPAVGATVLEHVLAHGGEQC